MKQYCDISLTSRPFPSLLQPQSHASSYNSRQTLVPHTQDDIRLSTVQLSNMLMSPPAVDPVREPSGQLREQDSFIFPAVGRTFDDSAPSMSLPTVSVSPPRSPESSVHSNDLSASESSLASSHAGTRTPKGKPGLSFKPSGLSLLLASRQEQTTAIPEMTTDPTALSPSTPTAECQDQGEPDISRTPVLSTIHRDDTPPLTPHKPKSIHWENLHSSPSNVEGANNLTEATPLLGTPDGCHPSYFSNGGLSVHKPKRGQDFVNWVAGHIREATKLENIQYSLVTSFKSIPAVVLGSLLNILDGVSCE
jgi:hypothetical protein